MNKELVIYYLKRHLLVLAGLLLALGFVGYGVKFAGDAKALIDEADNAFTKAKGLRDNIFTPPSGIKVDDQNITRYQEETRKLGGLIGEAENVIADQRVLVPFHDSIKFTAHMGNVIKQLNLKATERGVMLPKDPDNTSDVKFPYYFTFFEVITKKHGVPESKMDELQVQLADVETIMNILLNSRIQSIEMFQRNRVTQEDLDARSTKDYVDDRKKYQNSLAVFRPYRIRFRCLSGGIANVLSGLAKEKLFHVVRKVEVAQASSSSAAGGVGGMGMGGMGERGGEGEEGGEGGDFFDPGGGPGGGLTPGGGRGPGGGGPGGGMGGRRGGFGGLGGPGGEGMGGAPGGAQASAGFSSIPLSANEHRLLEEAIALATPKAKNVLREKLLEVTIDLDIIRKIPAPPGAGGANNANPAMPAGAAPPAGQPGGLAVPATPTPAQGTTTPVPTPAPAGTPQPEN